MAKTSTSASSSVNNDSQCFSLGEFNRFHDRQSSSLRYEFCRVHDRIDAGFRAADYKLDLTNDRIDHLTQNVDRKFEEVDRRFDLVERKLEEVDHRLNCMDHRLNGMDLRLNGMDLSLRHMMARSRNLTLTRLHQKIHIIHVLDQSQAGNNTPIEPSHFPKNVKAFLHLRDDLPSLSSLCRVYDCAWKSWYDFQSDEAASDSDTASSNSTCAQTLEEAVEEHTEMAMYDLADVLGLDLDRLDQGLRQYEEFYQKQRQGRRERRKRAQSSLAAAHDVKRPTPCLHARQNRPSPPPPQVPDPELLKIALRDKSSSSPSLEPSIHTQLGWAVTSEKLEEHRDAERRRHSRPVPERSSPISAKS